jgi:electron-transferring-flavoprotein dehydrogenase
VTRETLEVDILIVGGGPAGMSAALRLAQLQKQHGGEPLAVAVLEKSREAAAHMLSGAVLDPSTLRDLIPTSSRRARRCRPVHTDHVYFLTSRGKVAFPIIPPPLRNHGNYIISLNCLCAGWRSRSKRKASMSSPDSRPGRADGRPARARRANGRPRCRPAR